MRRDDCSDRSLTMMSSTSTQAEATEDLLRFGGVSPDEELGPVGVRPCEVDSRGSTSIC